jgi:hypothetical protein
MELHIVAAAAVEEARKKYKVWGRSGGVVWGLRVTGRVLNFSSCGRQEVEAD